MATKIYVGNLSFATTVDQLERFFSQAGPVCSANVVQDLYTGRSRGFGFVLMETAEAADKAITRLNGADLDGRSIRVGEAKPRNVTARRYAEGFPSNKSGYGSDLGTDHRSSTGYGTIYRP